MKKYRDTGAAGALLDEYERAGNFTIWNNCWNMPSFIFFAIGGKLNVF